MRRHGKADGRKQRSESEGERNKAKRGDEIRGSWTEGDGQEGKYDKRQGDECKDRKRVAGDKSGNRKIDEEEQVKS